MLKAVVSAATITATITAVQGAATALDSDGSSSYESYSSPSDSGSDGCEDAAARAVLSPDLSCTRTFMMQDTCNSLQMPMSASVDANALSDLPAMYSPLRLLSMMRWR